MIHMIFDQYLIDVDHCSSILINFEQYLINMIPGTEHVFALRTRALQIRAGKAGARYELYQEYNIIIICGLIR